MTYPAEIMTVTELSAFLKVKRDLVLQWCHVPGNQFAYVNPEGERSGSKRMSLRHGTGQKESM